MVIKIISITILLLMISAVVEAESDTSLYKSAIGYLKAGDKEFAFMTFRQIVQDYPKSKYADESQFRIAEFYFKEKVYFDAGRELTKHLELYPDSPFKKKTHLYLQKLHARHLAKKDDALYEEKDKVERVEKAQKKEETTKAPETFKKEYEYKVISQFVEKEEEKNLQERLKDLLHMDKDDRLGAFLQIGYLGGHTSYDFDHHTSELEFPMDNWMLGCGLYAELNKYNLSINTDFWTNTEDRAGYMKDKDWSWGNLYSYTESPSELNTFIWDINLKYDFYKKTIMQIKNKLGILLGYTYEEFDYDMYELYYVIDQVSGYQGQTLYQGQKVLEYEITYHLPYVGLAADFKHKRWGIGGNVKYSFYPTAEDVDHHLLRNLVFYGDYDNDGEVWMGSVYGFWNFAKHWKLKVGLDGTYIRIDGRTWEESYSPSWDKEQSTDARHFLGWVGVEYEF